MGEQRRLDIAAFSADLVPARRQPGPFGLPDGDIVQHLGLMHRMDQRPDHGFGVERMADLDPPRPVGDHAGEAVIDRRFDQQA